jgi:nitrogen-specific signal transduction histidine kinase
VYRASVTQAAAKQTKKTFTKMVCKNFDRGCMLMDRMEVIPTKYPTVEKWLAKSSAWKRATAIVGARAPLNMSLKIGQVIPVLAHRD